MSELWLPRTMNVYEQNTHRQKHRMTCMPPVCHLLELHKHPNCKKCSQGHGISIDLILEQFYIWITRKSSQWVVFQSALIHIKPSPAPAWASMAAAPVRNTSTPGSPTATGESPVGAWGVSSCPASLSRGRFSRFLLTTHCPAAFCPSLNMLFPQRVLQPHSTRHCDVYLQEGMCHKLVFAPSTSPWRKKYLTLAKAIPFSTQNLSIHFLYTTSRFGCCPGHHSCHNQPQGPVCPAADEGATAQSSKLL